MKIGFDAKRFAVNATGLGVYSRNLVQALSQHAPQHTLHLFSPLPVRPPWGEGLPSNVQVHAPPQTPNWWQQQCLRRQQPQRQAAALALNVFHGLSNSLPPDLPCARVVTIHDLIFLKDPRWHDWLNRQRYEWLARRACQQADVVVAVSASVKADIVHYFGVDEAKVRVVYQHVSPLFSLQARPQAGHALAEVGLVPGGYWLHVGGAERRKNPFAVLQAFALAAPVLSHMQLVFTGRSKSLGVSLCAQAQALGLAKRVHFLGHVPQALLPVLYQQAAVCLYPSYIEGFGLPVLEALQCGALCLVSNHPSLDEVCGQATLRAAPDDAQALAEGLLALTKQPSLAQQLRQAMPRQVAQFTPQRCITALLQAYQVALQRSQQRQKR